MRDLVVLSLEDWDDVWRRNQYLVSGLLDAVPDLRVLFVEPPADPLHELRRGRLPARGRGLRRLGERLWALRPVKPLPRRIDPHADERLARAAERAANRLGMTDPLLWVNDPAAVTLPERTGWRVLYDMTDDWLTADRPPAERRRIADGERWLLQHADVVVACSPELRRRKADARDDIVVVRNGVDTARYATPMPRPADAPAGPYALYLGTLHRDRIDVALCMATARALAGTGTLVLVGPEAWSRADGEGVRAAGGVVLGARERGLVPAYLQHAEVLVVPHVRDDFTDSLDPIKLYEYQAVGRPIVSTPVAGFRDAEGVTVAEGDAFADAVAAAVTAPRTVPVAAQGTTALAADWRHRVEEFRRAADL